MAKTQTTVDDDVIYDPNRRVFDAKEERRIEKTLFSVERKMEIVKKLRDNSRALKNAKLIKKGAVSTGYS